MHTIRLYQQDVYLKEAAAHVTGLSEKKGKTLVTLDQSLFFPTGGGQSCDKGTLAGYPVLDVYEENGEVYHLVDCKAEDLPAPGSDEQVTLILDWAHRFDNMQRHCGEHIMSGIFYREFGGVNRGFHMGDQYMTIDISLEENPEFTKVTWDMAKHAEFCANQVIWSNAPVITRRFKTREEAQNLPLRKALALDEDITIVCVGSVDNPSDCVACCGTHPSTAGQVGMVKIYKVESNKGMFRIYMEAGERAFRAYQQEYDTLTELGNRLSAGTADLLKKYQAQQEKNNEARMKLGQLRRLIVSQEAQKIKAALAAGPADHTGSAVPSGVPTGSPTGGSEGEGSMSWSYGNLACYYDILTLDDLLNVAKELFASIPKVLYLVHRPSHTVLLCSGGKPDCGKLVKENASIYGGKGGGNATSARAIFQKEEYVDTFIALISNHLR